MMIAVINESTRLTDATALRAMVDAVNKQLLRDLYPVWAFENSGTVVQVCSSESQVFASDWPIIILDDSDQANALGYHSETPGGQPYGRVFVAPVLDNGGTLTSGANSVSAVLSHECCETVVDTHVNLWAMDGAGLLWALESADWTENDSYDIDGIAVSNFVLPSAFDPNGEAPFDYLKLMTAPFQIRPGGYAVTLQGSNMQQAFGDDYPKFKLASKDHPASRTYRRLHR